jgi:hypothetical protein
MHRAVGSAPGTVFLTYRATDPGGTHVRTGTEPAGVAVPVRTLDSLAADAGVTEADYIKIDVEGYELEVLRGARQLISASPRIVVQVEHWDTQTNPYGHTLEASADLLFSLGLAPYRPDRFGALRPAAWGHLGAQAGDVLWCQREASG